MRKLIRIVARSAVALAAALLVTLLVMRSGEPVPVARASFFEGLRIPHNIAHRGASGERAEHTWDAYDLALRQGTDILELDVRMTKDGILVVAHDRNLKRVANVDLNVVEATLAELRAAAGSLAPLPLADVLARYAGRINLEIKEDRREAADALAALLRASGREKTVIVASFHTGVLEHFRDVTAGAVATSAHSREGLFFYLAYRMGIPMAPRFVALQIPRRISRLDLGDTDFVKFAHAHGLAVHYWTIDDEVSMRELLDAGADGVMTNHPERLEQAISAARRPR